MISRHILYPRTDDDSTFDMEYYASTHMPMVAEAFGDDCLGWGASEMSRGDFMAIGWCNVTDKDSLKAGLTSLGEAIINDVPNYTNVIPQTVIGNIAK